MSFTSIIRYLNTHGYRGSEILSETAEEENPEDDLYATYAMLHTYRTEWVPPGICKTVHWENGVVECFSKDSIVDHLMLFVCLFVYIVITIICVY